MVVHTRAVRFEEVDAAGIVFFGCYANYAHEAMEALFAEVEGGYPRLINERRIGFPAVGLEVAYEAPLRYGDVLRIEVVCGRLGNRSADLRYRFIRQDGVCVARMKHTVVVSDLDAMASVDMPADVRAILSASLQASAGTSMPHQ